MKKTIGATIGVLVVVALALAIIPTTRDEVHWRWASHKDETASYEAYVTTWPDGRHAAEAQVRYDEHGWTDAQAANTVQGFDRYVQLHGEGKHVAEAKDNIESLHWQDATAANTIRSYRAYTSSHPQGKFARQSETKATAIRTDQSPYDTALRTGTEASIRAFLADYPGHTKEAAAQQALRDIMTVIEATPTTVSGRVGCRQGAFTGYTERAAADGEEVHMLFWEAGDRFTDSGHSAVVRGGAWNINDMPPGRYLVWYGAIPDRIAFSQLTPLPTCQVVIHRHTDCGPVGVAYWAGLSRDVRACQ